MSVNKPATGENIVRVTVSLAKETYRQMRIIAADRDSTAAHIMADVLTGWTRDEFRKLELKPKG
jgi:hypothetical protein